MPLRAPNLDDRDFDQLVEDAKAIIRRTCPEWTDLSAGDPGIVLLEVFAYLTETMIYRLNRVPEKAYIEFLRMIGVRLQPPSAARTTLTFTAARAGAPAPITIPRGTRVAVTRSASGSAPVIFATAHEAKIPPDRTSVDVVAHHCELAQGEFAGTANGLPGFSVTAARPPIVAPTGEDLDLVVGVEILPGELDGRAPAIGYDGVTYRIWREVENFNDFGPDPYVYVADRMTGQILFAPAVQMKGESERLTETAEALAATPAKDRAIRLWYRRGGGPEGNVAANTLTTLKDPIAGVQVNNAEAATGGRSGESLENALVRGPQDLHSLRRAVTARDFETLALRISGAVSRAKAFTRSALWAHAAAGTVEVLLVPELPEEQRTGRVGIDELKAQQTEAARGQIQRGLEERRPLGTDCLVNWARCKSVSVQARVVASNEEDPAAIRKKVLDRLHAIVNPLPTPAQPTGWRFGQALRASNVYDIALSQPGVAYVDRVQLVVGDVPDLDVKSICADYFQPRTWHAGSGPHVFRSMDDGDGWDLAATFDKEIVQAIAAHPGRPGLVAAVTEIAAGGSGVYVSEDCGESWSKKAATSFSIEDAAWVIRDGAPLLLMATGAGLFQLSLEAGAAPEQVFVFDGDHKRGFYAVAVASDARGNPLNVAVAAQVSGGVYLSRDGQANTFRKIGLDGQDVRVLAVQSSPLLSFLWAGTEVITAGDAGNGCYSWQLLGDRDPPEKWIAFNKKWNGGSCRSIAFHGDAILAGTHHGGVLRLAGRRDDAQWETPDLNCGLPVREADRLFHPIDAVAVNPLAALILAGGTKGIHRSSGPGAQGAARYARCSNKVFQDKVTLPPTGLFCSGEHDITVVTEDEAEGD